ncbi:malto-oligosyltrehalose synthase [Pedobacter sp. AJM]|uniref:malto-oligosyltrehalose synthase n=1 Tax=Pedobacter sp. AJM TaxID=2003629 RepID=UPI000B4BC52F|nr:malto-oligosyltrehalose synthase [Pedobacter sp. AJM]OWK69686.1 4-alpha-glucanotransferase [Pedobacter sp. AJM]
MYKPSSTYRIQFNQDFTFQSLRNIIPYLKKLGIDTIYASPIFESSPGSMHGYDTINPHKINPEIGTEAELYQLSADLKAAGMGWLQDIVPNHMAFHTGNAWLMDVLKNGKKSAYSSFFDIDFSHETKLMVPFLGEDLNDAIANGALQLTAENGEYYLCYGGTNWPVSEATKQNLQRKNSSLINSRKPELLEIVNQQHYRLCNWQETFHKINYRRFFTVNSLICLNIQDKAVFDTYHEYIFKFVQEGIFQGLRIDHVDGLYDPKMYLDRLRKAIGDEVYVVIEKILEYEEKLPADWNTQGNTGYDFLAITNNLFTNKAAQQSFNKLYQRVTGKSQDLEVLIHEKKETILYEHMSGELDNLYQLAKNLELIADTDENEIGADILKKGIGEMMIQMPVYRYYDYQFPLKNDALNQLKKLISGVIIQDELKPAGAFLTKIFIEKPLQGDAVYLKNISQFYQRCMQFTGPLMAKGVEDTVMFTYNLFVGHTEVGDAPHAFGISIEDFHSKMIDRQEQWPLSLNGSATHDTKKGEDVRARLNVLTDLPEDWIKVVETLLKTTSQLKAENESFKALHNNDMYLVIQTILGVLSMPGEDTDDIHNRLAQYIEKALREAKKRSGWASPDEDYEQSVKDFATALIKPGHSGNQAIPQFIEKIADFGIINSLSQQVLKFTCPGIPDIYQGTELWDLSLVDPDNRRPVDYDKRIRFQSEQQDQTLKELWEGRYSGKIKLWLTQRLATVRKNHAQIFEDGQYIPLQVLGKFKHNVVSFARYHRQEWIVVTVPLGLAAVANKDTKAANKFDWADTEIILPAGATVEWDDLITGASGVKDILNKGILINQILSEVPVGLVKLKSKENDRSAGILMHISSLPSDYGIGDIGPESRSFIDFLTESGQKYWQILPVNPTKSENGHSPYSSNSAMAGNILLISPDLLQSDGLLKEADLKNAVLESADQVDYDRVEEHKHHLLKLAYHNFRESPHSELHKSFETFCTAEKSWLHDFSLYVTIKGNNRQQEWYHWPEQLKTSDPNALAEFIEQFADEVEEIKWQQFIFFKQWHELKDYANQHGIQIVGDLPFYLDLDSVEVWSQPSFFKLGKDLKPLKIAGVPPDYFNENGQLWGMPIFNWEAMKAERYTWWVNRLKKNMELFDLLRLDHFRAFSSFWEVDADAKTAINGKWIDGPGNDFFEVIESELGQLPFIAEDLGEITSDVEQLRERFKLPGMKVLQFAFGSDLINTTHIPHNFSSSNCLVYTGTHDNNTLLGWFKEEADDNTKKRLDMYFGFSQNEENICQTILRAVYSAVAAIAIVPVQDILNLDESARMNTPGRNSGNWKWRLTREKLDNSLIGWLKMEMERCNRKR